MCVCECECECVCVCVWLRTLGHKTESNIFFLLGPHYLNIQKKRY